MISANPNIIIKLAQTKYAANVAISAAVRWIVTTRKSLEAEDFGVTRAERMYPDYDLGRSMVVDPLYAYFRGSMGEEGFCTMGSLHDNPLKTMYRKIDCLRSFHNQLEMLIIMLQALGEEIEY